MKKAIFAFILFVLLILLLNSIYFVREDEYVIIKRFDRIVNVEYEAGLGFKMPFIDTRTSLTKKYVMYDLTPTDVLTKDKKSMIADTYAVWRITDPRMFEQNAGNVYELLRRIDASVYGNLKSMISAIDQVEIIESRTDNSLNSMILDRAKTSLEAYGVELIDVQIKRFDLPESNKNAVYDRMISERNQIAATYTAEGEEEANMIRNTADKEKEIIVSRAKAQGAELEAEGESEFMRILSSAYNDHERASFYEFIRTLDSLKTTMKGDKTLILPNDSVITQSLIGADINESVVSSGQSRQEQPAGYVSPDITE